MSIKHSGMDELDALFPESTAPSLTREQLDELEKEGPVGLISDGDWRALFHQARRALELEEPKSEEQTTRERLGRWLSAEPDRSWSHDPDVEYDNRREQLVVLFWNEIRRTEASTIERRRWVDGTGATFAAALIAALDLVEWSRE